MIKVKPGVICYFMSKPIMSILPIIDMIWELQKKHPTITSWMEIVEERPKNTKHNIGLAIDLRHRDLSDTEKHKVFNDMKILLGRQYDVIWEKTHFHVEYDPK